jgi:hypothetical protein
MGRDETPPRRVLDFEGGPRPLATPGAFRRIANLPVWALNRPDQRNGVHAFSSARRLKHIGFWPSALEEENLASTVPRPPTRTPMSRDGRARTGLEPLAQPAAPPPGGGGAYHAIESGKPYSLPSDAKNGERPNRRDADRRQPQQAKPLAGPAGASKRS